MVSGKNGSLSDVDYAALANLRYRIRKFRQFSTKAAEKLGLSPQQHQALLAIKGLGSGEQMSVSTLAARLFVPAASAAELTRSLEGRGYVTIEVKQRRRTIVRLTDKAEEILRRLTPAHLYEIREMAPELMLALRVLQDHRRMEVAAWMQ
ncbi:MULTISPECIES: MarR family transcriptional regulator [Rhizobium]|jgi:DNA-binding MarR family transcriptional regulator|uniref:MarR family winged helix-turn-helix transcriptional regulator n=1 Tax=Rhizobium TaxID=379 RepID=UPI00035F77DD|nr:MULTISPECIES: MarR family transcriptional regulator [unclassified Rhizobium]MBD9449574.1 MarR family transcriptional regulator [Rhizobium sp. RHZ01]MBD9451015.1 MarR family transcriptional regulator [Rhizobium sp. RHZ02]